MEPQPVQGASESISTFCSATAALPLTTNPAGLDSRKSSWWPYQVADQNERANHIITSRAMLPAHIFAVPQLLRLRLSGGLYRAQQLHVCPSARVSGRTSRRRGRVPFFV